jgi:hypothetical protein
MLSQENVAAAACYEATGRPTMDLLSAWICAEWFWDEEKPFTRLPSYFPEPEDRYLPPSEVRTTLVVPEGDEPDSKLVFLCDDILHSDVSCCKLMYLGFGAFARISRAYASPRRERHGQARERWLTLAQNVAYIKRLMPPAEKWEVVKATLKHREVLGTVHAPVEQDPYWAKQHRMDIRNWLTVIVYACFHGRVFRPTEPVPSTHACVERSGAVGGALVDLFLQTEEARSTLMNQPMGTQLDRLVEVAPGVVREVRKRDRAQAQLEEFSRAVSAGCEGLRRAPGPPGSDPFSPTEARAPYHVDVLPSAVVEPCKVRMITMGPAVLYQRALALQKFLWKTMKSVGMFQWIGKPITADDYEEACPADFVARSLHNNPDLELISGDYAAATDNLDPEVTLATINALADIIHVDVGDGIGWEPLPGRLVWKEKLPRLPSLRETIWYDILVATLIGHTLHHGERRVEVLENRSTEWDEGILQLWGQLMGAPCSFPILNLVNAAHTCAILGPQPPSCMDVCWVGMSGPYSKEWHEFWQRGLTYIRVNPNLIFTNGDDIQFLISRADYEDWVESGRSVGLGPSAGKNLRSRSFLQMNSEMRVLCECEGPLLPGEQVRPHVWRLNNFLNLPLLAGSEAKGPRAGTSQLSRIPYFAVGARARSLVAGADPDISSRRLHWWQQLHQPLLDRCPPGLIWECPEQLGGLGVPRYRDTEPPEWALKRCAYLACLDIRSRLKAVTPPRATEVCPWLRGLTMAMSRGLEIERVSEPPRDEVWWDRDPVKGASAPGAVLANFLTDWTPEDYAEDELSSYSNLYIRYPLGIGREVAKPIWAKYLAQDRVEILQTAAQEMKHRRSFGKISRLAIASPLHPMRSDHLEQWSDRRVLSRQVVQPAYDTTVRLK